MPNLDIIRGRQVVIPLMNRTGGDVVNGDVVVLDPANDESFITTTTVASVGIIGVVQESIVNAGTGRVLIAGYAPLVKVGAAVTRGQFAETSAVAKQAGSSATRHVGSFAQWLTSSATPSAALWGLADNTVPPPASPITVEEADGTPTDSAVTKIIFPNGTLGIAAHVVTYTPTAVASGTSFPGSPTTGQRFNRTDLQVTDYFYDGTRWRSVQVFKSRFSKRADSATSAGDISTSISATGDAGRTLAPSLLGGSGIYLLDFKTTFIVNGGTALGASHKWVVACLGYDLNTASTGTVATQNIDSGASSVYRELISTINAVQAAGTLWYQNTLTKTGTPGTWNSASELSYQVIAT